MSLLILGDFFYGYDYIADDIVAMGKYIRRNNIKTILNLEGPITKSKDMILKRGEHLRQSDLTLEVLRVLNVVGVVISNNHIMDFGCNGLKETIDLLDNALIKHTGAGIDLESARKPIVVCDEGLTYQIFGMTDSYEEAVIASTNQAGCAPISVLDNVKHKEGYFNIAILHTGFEYNTMPMPRNIKQNRELVKIGYDLVVGCHPHVTQTYEIYENRPIFYSIGNFYFSSFRDEFEKKVIMNKSFGFCNYGIGVCITDSKMQICDIYYQKDMNMSVISRERPLEELHIGRNGFRYAIECMRNRNNHNPILSGNDLIDNISLRFLFFLYRLYRKLRGIKSV